MARLLDEYPLVFEEWVNLFDRRDYGFLERREKTRASRVGRLLARMRG